MAALFGGSSGDGRREPKSLIEFRAGKMQLSGTTVTADTRKGLVYMKLDDGLVHFYWKDRKTSKVVDDLIIFPGDAEFKRVSKCNTGRVYILKFKDSSRKYFYWMQEPKEEKDEDFMKKVNEIIEHPPDPSQVAADNMPGLSGLPAGLINNPQIMEQLISSGAIPPGLLGLEGLGRGGSATSPRSAGGGSSASTSNNAPSSSTSRQQTPSRRQQQQQQQQESRQPSQGRQIQLGDLQNILSAIPVPEAQSNQERVSLNEAVTPDVLRPLSNDSSVQQQVSDYLPPTSEDVPTILNSPQFHQALGVFGSALQSGQLGPLMNQFGLGQGVTEAANTGDVQQFAEALQAEMGSDNSATADSSDKAKEDEKNDKKSTNDKDDKDSTAK